MPDAPTLKEIFENPRIKAISFWCNEHTCHAHETWPKGQIAIDHGPGSTLADLMQVAYCRECRTQELKIVPNWGEGGLNPFEAL
jgi:hypothetical protein